MCLRLGMCFYLGRFSVVFAYIFFQNQTVREANVFKIFILNILCSASMSKFNPGRRQTRSKNNCVVTIIFGLFFQFKFFRIKMLQSLTILKSWKFCWIFCWKQSNAINNTTSVFTTVVVLRLYLPDMINFSESWNVNLH